VKIPLFWVFLVALVFFCLVWLTDYSEANSQMDAVASTFAQHEVKVVCDPQDEMFKSAWGYVYLTDPLTLNEAPYLCAALENVNDGLYGLSRRALAILVLIHESYHQRLPWGDRGDEAKVECKAIRHFRYGAQFLGASPEFATALRAYALVWHWRLAAKYPEYNLEGCKVPNP